MTEAKTIWAELRKPFPPSQVGQLPRGQTTLDYVGHADVTSRLLEVDPEWNWQPVASDEHGLPVFDTDAQDRPVGLWIRLTVGGVTRLGYGSCPSNQNDAVKVLIGDALRNAAMRFGVALDLWAKGDRADPAAENATASGGQAQKRRPQQADYRHPPPRPPSQLPRNQDGSLSRSQITDEEMDGAGVMTTAQQKEHTALRKGAVTGKSTRPHERLSDAAPDDEWTTPPETDAKWYAEVEAEIRKLTTDEYGEVLRRRVVEKTEAGGCTKKDAEKLRTLIRARRQALAAEAEVTAGA